MTSHLHSFVALIVMLCIAGLLLGPFSARDPNKVASSSGPNSEQQKQEQQQNRLQQRQQARNLAPQESLRLPSDITQRSPLKLARTAAPDGGNLNLIISERTHEPFVDPHKSGLGVVVIGTGHMREYQRCSARLVSALLQPNAALMTMTTYPTYNTLGPSLASSAAPGSPNSANPPFHAIREQPNGKRKLVKLTKKMRRELIEQNTLPTTVKMSVTHDDLRRVYGEHLALSVMLDPAAMLQLATANAPGVTFSHFLTVLAQWALIEIAYEKTMGLLNNPNATSPAWADLTRNSPDRIVFMRIRPDVFIIGTQVLFRMPAKGSSNSGTGGIVELSMTCGADEEAPVLRGHSPRRYTLRAGASSSSHIEAAVPPKQQSSVLVAVSDKNLKTSVWRTPPFPEFVWPLDPLSDFSAISVGAVPMASDAGDGIALTGEDGENRATALGYRMWSWMLGRPFPENYSFYSPENITTIFLRSVGLDTVPVQFGWHFVLRPPGFKRSLRRSIRVAKYLKYNGTRAFRTDNATYVRCPPLPLPDLSAALHQQQIQQQQQQQQQNEEPAPPSN